MRVTSNSDDSQPVPNRELPGDQLFADDQLLEIRISLSEQDHQSLEERGNEEVYVSANATISGDRIGQQLLENVGLRHKGAYSLHHCWDQNGGVRSYEGVCAKLSYKIKFNKFNDELRLDGLKRLNLHASSGDATRLHELVAYDTFRSYGIEAPRTAVARVFVNDQPQGLFIVVEAIDGRFTKSHFAEGGGDGNLYKEIWPSPEVSTAAVLDGLETNEEISDVSGFLDFARAVGDSSAPFAGVADEWIDVDHTLRYIAVDRALRNWDGIMAFYSPLAPHNFYWYHDAEGSGRFHLVPWDMDNTLWEFDPYMAPEQWVSVPAIPDWNEEPLNCDRRPVWAPDSGVSVTPPRCDPFLDILAETQWQRFELIGQELLATTLDPDRMLERVQHFAGVLEPVIAEDPFLDIDEWRAQRLVLDDTVQQARADFQRLLSQGLISEQAEAEAQLEEEAQPEEEAPPQSLPQVSEPGLVVTGVNGFEGLGALTPEGFGMHAYTADGSSLDFGWNTAAPISGSADLRADFRFGLQPGAYDEWVNLGIPTLEGQEVDLRGFSRIVVSLAADRSRQVRVRLTSPVYEESFGDAWSEFGIEVQVSSSPARFELPLDDFSYPQWAKDAWSAGQGWTSNDAEAFALVRHRFTGLLFVPGASFDAQGNLIEDGETGYLQIDDISFE